MYEAVELQLEEESYYESVKSRIDENRFANHKLLREFLDGARRFRRNGQQKQQAEMESILSEGESWSSVEEDDGTLGSEIEKVDNDAIKDEISVDDTAFFREREVGNKDKVTMNHLPFYDFLNTKVKKTEQPIDIEPPPIHVHTERESLKENKADNASFLEKIREEPDWASSSEETDNDRSSGEFAASYSFNRNWSEMATRSIDNVFVPNVEESSSTVVSVASPPIPKKNELNDKEAKKKCTINGLFKNCLGKRDTRHHSLVQQSESKTSLPEPPIPKNNELNDKETKRKCTSKGLFKNFLGKRTSRRHSLIRQSESETSLPEYAPEYDPGYEPLVISKTESFKDQRVPFSAASVKSVACVAPLSSSFSGAKSHQDSEGER